MAGSYTLPQVKVFQEFAMAPNDVTQNLNPFVIGANYQLIRYADKKEREDCSNAEYVGSTSVTLGWKAGYDGSVVDTSWFDVTLDKAQLKLNDSTFRYGTDVTCLDASEGGTVGTKFEFRLGDGKSLIGDDPADLAFGVPVRTGDFIRFLKSDNSYGLTKIRAISAGIPGEDEYVFTTKDAAGQTYAGFTFDVSAFKEEKPVTLTITVKDGASDGAQKTVKITSTVTGIGCAEQNVPTSGGEIDLGLGLKMSLSATGTWTAGRYRAVGEFHEPYCRDTVTVSDNVVFESGKTTFDFVRVVDSVEVGEADREVVEASTDYPRGGIKVLSGVMAYVGTHAFPVIAATAYLTQRNFRKDFADGVYSARTDADIIRDLGAITPDNPLAYGVHVMLLNSASVPIRYIALESDDKEGWVKALDRASVTTDVYAFCPLTDNLSVIKQVVDHCNKLSAPEEKSWRIAFFSTVPEESVDVTPQDGSSPATCTVSDKELTCAVASFIDTVRSGDAVTVVDSNGVQQSTKVDSVKSNTVLVLVDAITNATTARPFTVVHTMGRAEYVGAVATRSASFNDHRAYNVFPNSLRDTDGNVVPGMFGAAAVCALACSVLPQQPITNVEIKGFSDLHDVYSKYSREELNTIAGGGTLILMQEKAGGVVYVRHQISTADPSGNLNKTELSMIKNLDSISYYFANRCAPYHGRYNVTDDLLAELKGVITDGLAHLETTTEGNKLIGPQVLAEGTELRALYKDPSQKDHVVAQVALNLPAPFNNFDLYLFVI